MTLQERQKREIERLNRVLSRNYISVGHRLTVEAELKLVTEDPETYFKNIDEEE